MEEAGEHDIVVEQGSGFSLSLTYEAPEGSPVDFTGAAARMHIREKYSSSTTLVELTTANDRIELGADGSIELSLTADVTAALKFNQAVYDLEIVPGTGEPYKIIRGSVFLKREVTRSYSYFAMKKSRRVQRSKPAPIRENGLNPLG